MNKILGTAVLILATSCGIGPEAGPPLDFNGGKAGDAAADGGGFWDNLPGEDGGLPPPEEEVEADFRVPAASGRYVYVPNASEDYVVVIDSLTLMLEIVDVGRRPIEVATQGLINAALVLNSGSRDLSLIKTFDPEVGSIVKDLRTDPKVEGMNSVKISPTGLGAIAYHDFDLPLRPGDTFPTESADVMVVYLESGNERSVPTVVGHEPREVEFNEAGTKGFIINKSGISIVDLQSDGVESPLPLVPFHPQIPNEFAHIPKDVDITPDGRFALVRPEESLGAFSTSVWLLDLESGEMKEIALPSIPYDLDLSPDGKYAVAVLPLPSQIALIPFPPDEASPFTTVNISGISIGQAQISSDGALIALFSSQSGEEKVGIFTVRDGRMRVIPLYKTVKTVAFTPQSDLLVVIHGKEEGPPPNPNNYEDVEDHSFGYSLVRLSDMFVKQVLTAAEPQPFLVHPNGSRIYLLLRDDEAGIKEAQVIHTSGPRAFQVDTVRLGSPPASIGYVPESDKVYISQEHPAGRITFIDARGNVETVTGFELEDFIVE